MARVNIVKQIKQEGRWKLVSIPENRKGGYDWNALPDGRYFIEWYDRGKRKREAAGATAAEALEAVRRKKHTLEGRALGVEAPEADDEPKATALHLAVKHYLTTIAALKKPNTHRKYKAVLDRFVEFLPPQADPRKISRDARGRVAKQYDLCDHRQ